MTKLHLAECYRQHCRTVWNICYPYFMNDADTEDAVQNTFLRLYQCKKPFSDSEHEKAWLIVTARNVCRDELKRAARKNLPLDDAQELPAAQKDRSVLQAMRQLPDKYGTVLYLHYYEGYSTAEIAKMTDRSEATVRSELYRARQKLKTILEEQQ